MIDGLQLSFYRHLGDHHTKLLRVFHINRTAVKAAVFKYNFFNFNKRIIQTMLIKNFKNRLKNIIKKENQKFLYDLNRKILTTQYDNKNIKSEYTKGGGADEIIVSLTTHTKRINYIHFTLDSLYHQILRPHSIYLYITKDEYESLPEILNNFKPWLKIFYTEDIGSYKKFIPALKNAKDNQIIISLDDDFLFPHYLIYDLYCLYKQHQNDRALFAFNGTCWTKSPYFGIGGGMGLLWNPKIFNSKNTPLLFKKSIFLNEYKNQDDSWITKCCKQYAIPIYALCEDDYNQVPFIPDFIPLPSATILAITNKG